MDTLRVSGTPWLRKTPTAQLQSAEPLWKRVPTHDEDGRPLADFMLLIPGLNTRPQPELDATVARISATFGSYGNTVVFADLNLSLNLLWVSVRPLPGICLELAAALKCRVPEALLVAQQTEG